MAEPKPLCKFGENCYRKNPQHLKQFRHPKRKQEEDDEPVPKKAKVANAPVDTKGKNKKIEDFFGKKESKQHDLSDEEDSPVRIADEDIPTTDKDSEASEKIENSDDEDRASSNEEEEEMEAPESPVDVRENIKQKFLLEMPEDFYHFWDFCKAEKSANPSAALQSTLGFHLVGPFDILAGKHKGITKNKFGKRPNFLIHWRYYYDPPEFQTVIRGDDKTQFHLGYFRDDPKEMPAFVGANAAKSNCNISAKGDNLFAAVSFYIDEKIKSKDTDSKSKSKLKDLSERLQSCAKKYDQSLELKTKGMKARDKKVVCKSFHGAGIVVPVDENEVGYREVPETPADLKRMFKKIADSSTDKERDTNFEALQELITLIQFANDECDYGEGLELGMDLFCYGGKGFHSTIMQLMPLAYMLLGRTEYEKIIEAHLKNRHQDVVNLNQLE